jgi:hypothetical protein
MLALVDEAVEALRQQPFLEQVNAAYATLRSDPRAWEEVESERRGWAVTLGDGLVAAESRAPHGRRPRSGSGAREGGRRKRS